MGLFLWISFPLLFMSLFPFPSSDYSLKNSDSKGGETCVFLVYLVCIQEYKNLKKQKSVNWSGTSIWIYQNKDNRPHTTLKLHWSIFVTEKKCFNKVNKKFWEKKQKLIQNYIQVFCQLIQNYWSLKTDCTKLWNLISVRMFWYYFGSK